MILGQNNPVGPVLLLLAVAVAAEEDTEQFNRQKSKPWLWLCVRLDVARHVFDEMAE
ncbi:hypothetical protein C1H46_008755 [Malus baccata]|uniref:Secreted protein n=1 Tax=Malus baccata TaxID=106549 RepID=A0A540N3J5_MALBA|nr:hypothetical protein C1H46_008755 [Malus baccata]